MELFSGLALTNLRMVLEACVERESIVLPSTTPIPNGIRWRMLRYRRCPSISSHGEPWGQITIVDFTGTALVYKDIVEVESISKISES